MNSDASEDFVQRVSNGYGMGLNKTQLWKYMSSNNDVKLYKMCVVLCIEQLKLCSIT